ncbi:MAG TPA: hypothetical protein VGM90_20440 [Kofleriaceae bacterium]|jgi:hypothetical protein
MNRALLLVLVAASSVAGATSPAAAGTDDAKATEILQRIAKGPDANARKAAIKELDAIAPTAVEGIGAWLAKEHATSVDDRRTVLVAIKALVPDKKGRFDVPARASGKELQADDDLDWMAKLLDQPDSPALGETIADDAAIRALAESHVIAAAQPIFDAAFNDSTMIYRDECGRYLRKMEPYSIPVLTKEAAGKNDRKRYGTYQLERMDRQEPGKALAAAAGDEALTIAIIEVFKETKIREAVHAVWLKVNDDRPRVRAAARDAWKDYITGPPPPGAPRQKLKLPGGKFTKKEKPMWLTYRELADNELRKAANDLLHEDYPIEDPTSLTDTEKSTKPVKIDLVSVSQQLYDYYDGERTKIDAAAWTAAKAKADANDLPASAAMLDRLLAQNPNRENKDGMADIYFRFGKQLEDKKQYADAAAAYSKSEGLAPKGPHAKDALAAHYFMLGKSLEATGKDGGPDFRRAVALKPDYAPAQDAAAAAPSSGSGKRPVWMLYAAVLAGGVALLLFALAMVRRRSIS